MIITILPDVVAIEQKNIINYLLVSIMVLVIVVLFINYKTIRVPVFGVTAFAVFLFDINLFVLNHISHKQIGFMPFKALFGPLFLFHIKMFNASRVSIKSILWHLAPFVALLAAFFYLSLKDDMAASMYYYYLIILVEGCSMFIYGLYALLPRHTRHSIALRNIISICGIAFILDALFTIMSSLSILHSKKFDIHHLNFVNNTFFCVSVLLGWIYFFCAMNMMINPADVLYPSLKYFEEQEANTPLTGLRSKGAKRGSPGIGNSYKKGRLSDEVLLKYEEQLNELMQKAQPYLDSQLTLTVLAKMLKISSHHLTQVFNIRIQSNFYQYINRLRIAQAITLIDAGAAVTNLRILAMDCGFNNQASFNRYFKEITGVPPSVYLKNKSVHPIP